MIIAPPQNLLLPNKGNQRPSRMLFLDTETKTQQEDDIEKHRMDLAWTLYCQTRKDRKNDTEQWQYWEDTKKLWTYVETLARPRTVLYIFGHNVFFDLQASDFFYHMSKSGWVLRFWYDKGLTYILSISKGRRVITCISTTNYFPVSLKALGDLIGLEKIEVDFKTTPRSELKEYCKRDVEIVRKAVDYWIEFVDVHDLGNFSMTRAAQAFTAFRHRLHGCKIAIHKEESLSEFERKAYHGGRVECGFIGKVERGPFVSLDVNSMYSYVMKAFEYPVRYVDSIPDPDARQIKDCLKNYCVIARVFLDTSEPVYAVRRFHKVVFPVGRFAAYLCTEGLKYALSHRHVQYIEEIKIYQKGRPFIPYVDFFHTLKEKYEAEKNLIMRRICKDYLNSLYGKFAQKRPVTEEEEQITYSGYERTETKDLVTGKTEITIRMLNKFMIIYGEETGRRALVAVSAHVTENARLHLWNIMKDIGIGKILYCDTDSVKIRKADLRHVKCEIADGKLGALKLEEEFKKFHIYGPKDYETENVTKIKGIPPHAEKVEDGVYKYTSFARQATHLDKQITRYYITTPMVKRLKRVYTKGKTLDDGTTRPITLSETATGLSLFSLPVPPF